MLVLSRSALAVCVLLVGCGDDGLRLVVDLKTDLVAGIEIERARTSLERIDDGGRTSITMGGAELRALGDLARGARIAEIDGLTPGIYVLRVELIDARGARVVERRVSLQLAQDFATLIVIARDCVAFSCPGTGDPASSTECFAGRCVSPECGGTGACGPPECDSDSDCPTPAAACAIGRCEDGACFAVPRVGACGTGDVCVSDEGCVPLPDATDAGGSTPIDGGGSAPTDADADGSPAGVDCDDGSAARHPGAAEICGNGVDEDCNGIDPQCDADGDGSPTGVDCDDFNPARRPGAPEVCANGVDEDCSGGDVPCFGQYGMACGAAGACDDSASQHLACVGGACWRCCALCANRMRYHWVNVDSGCTAAVDEYCAVGDRGGAILADWTACEP